MAASRGRGDGQLGLANLPGGQQEFGSDITVLCVDDEEQVLELTATYLEREQATITVETATSPAEAREILSETDVSCIVSDYQMPRENGIEFLRSVREANPELPFILYTGKGSEEVASEAIAAGVTDYFQKSSGTEQYAMLAAQIEQAVDAYRARRMLEVREEQFRTLVEGSTDGIAVLDSDGAFQYVSPGVERILGYDPSELVGQDAIQRIHPDDREPVVTSFEEALADPSVTPTEEFRYEDARGEWRWLEAYGRNLLDNPAIEGFVVNLRDITERKHTETRYERLLDESPSLVAVLDDEGRIDWISPSAPDVIGHEQAELIGSNAFDLIHPDDLDDAIREFGRTRAGETPEQFEYRFKHADGSVRWLHAKGRDLSDDPTVGGFVVNAVDITERKRKEEQLREEKEFVETVLDTLNDLVYVFDTDGNPIRWNDHATDDLGYSDEEIESMHALDFVPDEDETDVVADMEQIFEEGEVENTLTIETAEGEQVPYEFHGARLETSEGEVLGFCGVGRDISDRVEREEALERYELLVETVADGVFMVDGDGRYTYANPYFEELTGRDREEFVGETAPMLVDDETAERINSAIEEMLREERDAATMEIEIETADRGAVPIEARFTILPTDGAYRGAIGVFRDISERIEREQQLRRQNERLEEFATILSHDLRTPLNVASGRLELAREDCESPHLAEVATAHRKMETLIEDLLAYAREGQPVRSVEEVDLPEVARDSWEAVATPESSLTVETDATVEADEARLERVFSNLFRNAVEHGGADVTVTVGELADESGFYVADDGPGIPEDMREEVFSPGYSTNDEGMGFGLRIVDQIAEAHGWEISATASDEGGARFEITGLDA